MSETLPRELKILIERVVRPLVVTREQKKRLRSEFSQHLETIFEEELAKDGDTADALARTKIRFGTPEDLTKELQETVGWVDQAVGRYQSSLSQRIGESTFRFSLRLSGVFFLMWVGTVFLLILGELGFGNFHNDPAKLWTAISVIPTYSILMISMQIFGLCCGEEWYRTPRRWGRIFGHCLGLGVSIPVSLLLLISMTGGNWSDYYRIPLFGIIILLGCLIFIFCGVYLGLIHHRETRFAHEWESLKIDGE